MARWTPSPPGDFPGGRILIPAEHSNKLTRFAAPALAVAGFGLLLGGAVWLTSMDRSDAHEYGMGGPEEPPLADTRTTAGLPAAGHLDLDRDWSFGSTGGAFVFRAPGAGLSTGELGPVFRPKFGPMEMRIGRGMTFYESLAGRGVAHEDIMTLVKACKSFRNLRNVRAGELFRIDITDDGGLRSLGFDLDEESHVTWTRQGDTYAREDGTYPVAHRLKGVSGTIEVSLYHSLQKTGAPLTLAPKMNDILGWDIDFNRDLRKGDTFRIVFDEVWKEDKLVRTGSIKALEIINRGKVKQAFRFTAEGGRPGYFDTDGNNMQKQLMRAPLDYSRISSGYSHRRLHPVLKRWMPHLGVDYAAPLGTPVRAGGDGVVVTATSKKGNGRYIQIRHTNREYETFYLHLSRYAKGIKSGKRVTQGQIIGYVGATGYATGPHLDYRVKRNGTFVNPRKLKLPAAAPVAKDLRPHFDSLKEMFIAALEDLPAGEPVPVAPIVVLEPPAWDAQVFAAAELPATVRAVY
ncbi:MAG: peptidoglycan DD-metalloendopeptidase family protein [Candidatus Krumholzibacteriota bacterium]